MIRNQCRAYCRCEQCAQDGGECDNGSRCGRRTRSDAAVRTATQRALTAAVPCRNDGCNTVDALYKQCLLDSLRVRSLQASVPNAGKFVPDEQLRSAAAQRDAVAFARASQLVPLRRRDRVQELLLLEHKARLREQARLRAERRALGLPDEDEDKTTADDEAEQQQEEQQREQQEREGNAADDKDTTAATSQCGCSAEAALRATLQTIRDVVDAEQDGNNTTNNSNDSHAAPRPLTRDHVYALRHLVHTQTVRAREAAAASAHAPRLCGHCFDVDVQARHLCPQPHAAQMTSAATTTSATAAAPSGSVAFDMTGKVINPGEGVKYGSTLRARDADGRYRSAAAEAAMYASRARMPHYNRHPYGAGVLFPALSNVPPATATTTAPTATTTRPHVSSRGESNMLRADGARRTPPQSTTTAMTTRGYVNNNVADEEGVDETLQYPGSTYNVYDRATAAAAAVAANDDKRSRAPRDADATAADGARGDKDERAAMTRTTPAAAAAVAATSSSSSSSLWRTTNQEREASLQRYMQFQKQLQSTARKVYDDTASRFTPAALAAAAAATRT